jgi:hypothetical protein
MKKILVSLLLVTMPFSGVQAANAHGGGLDWQGGHNCRVGSCAGTYHCHQAWGGICAPSSGSSTTKPKVTKPKVSRPVAAVCIDEYTQELSKGQVALLQTRLSTLGYSPGTTDGILGSQTLKELNKFEKDYDLLKSSKLNIHWDTIFTLGATCA